eukprot:CAMPEP_0180403868 /NCGR_PEP_ID=MMETSP0989-20121125/39671_1 /TAXON_ID=697907 /ORGANISM="non described non described, Strain CCMP2293" /LENGTH=59 /DNA_ID=CAMNT_0022407165 /DNA_START=43 /DNA_END=219 /DNA_ORIENTATION=-
MPCILQIVRACSADATHVLPNRAASSAQHLFEFTIGLLPLTATARPWTPDEPCELYGRG